MKFQATIVSAVMGATAASALGSSSLSLRARQARANGVIGVTPNAPATNAPAAHANGAPAVASSNTPTVRALHHSLGIQKVSGADANIMASNQDVVGTGGTGTPSFTKNYAGVVKAGAGQTIVSGTVVMPQPKVPAGADPAQEYVASTWVGMDGIDDDCSAILQTGIDMHITPGGNVSYEAWFEWYPEPALKATDFPVAPGDSITLSVTSTPADKKSGTAKLINHTNNKQVEHAFTGQTTALCQSNAEWIVEDTAVPDQQKEYPLADFGTVTFSDVVPDPTGAQRWFILQGNHLVTTCNIQGTNAVACKYNNQ